MKRAITSIEVRVAGNRDAEAIAHLAGQLGYPSHAEGHARRASAGDSGWAGSEVGGGEGTAEESPPAGRVTDEPDYFRSADNTGVIAS